VSENVPADRSTPPLRNSWLSHLAGISLSHPPDYYYWLLFSRSRVADRPPQGVLHLRPHVWRKLGIGKELHLVSNVDAVTKAIVVKPERRLS
jgi:hypothetical protein